MLISTDIQKSLSYFVVGVKYGFLHIQYENIKLLWEEEKQVEQKATDWIDLERQAEISFKHLQNSAGNYVKLKFWCVARFDTISTI